MDVIEGKNENSPGKPVLTNTQVLKKMKRPGDQENQANKERRDFEDKFNNVSGQTKEYRNWLQSHRIDG